MSDGRKNNGGARPGSGRKTKAEILGLAELIDESWPPAQQKAVIKKLAVDAKHSNFQIRHPSRTLLLSYKFGKPTEKHELTGKDGAPMEGKIIVEIVNGPDKSSNKDKD